MHVALHITTGCNMSCRYCYSHPVKRLDMTKEIAAQSMDFIARNYSCNTGIIFFGGEPLLNKELIRETIAFANTKPNDYHFKVTTNGTLLDGTFLDYADSVGLQISISMDGNEQAHNTFRRFQDGRPTFGVLERKVKLLLSRQPYTKVLMTVTPETVVHYADSVDYLVEKGFKYIIVSLNYAGDWTDKSLKELKTQYGKLARLYERLVLEERKVYFSPFEMKLASHIRQHNFECFRCHLGMDQISIAHDGKIYPCVQFVKDGVSNTAYAIGNVTDGMDTARQKQMYDDSKKQNAHCMKCDYNPRCNNKCSCLSWQLTGQLNCVTPVVCESERMLIPIVDRLGERLYRKGAKMFIQKHYNAIYPILSMIEDMR